MREPRTFFRARCVSAALHVPIPHGPDVSGPRTPDTRRQLAVGFTLQAPHIHYPAHHHEPPGVHGVISGHVEWQVGDSWATKSPGDVILHRPHESHLMRSRDVPVLNWVTWPRDSISHVYMPSLDPPETQPSSY